MGRKIIMLKHNRKQNNDARRYKHTESKKLNDYQFIINNIVWRRNSTKINFCISNDIMIY